jgi:iron complex transport system substrate-binding protein
MIARAAAALLALATPAAARVFSADYCADQYVLALAEPADIAALSPDAQRDFSYLRAAAAGLSRVRPGAEEAVASGADLVLRAWGGDAGAFERAGLRVVTLEDGADFDAIARSIRTAAAALGAAHKGETLIEAMEATLQRLADAPPLDIAAVYVTPGGVSAGAGTLIDAIIRAAGLRNRTAEAGLSWWPPLPLEALAAAPPDFIVAGFFDSGVRADQWSPARHPAYARIFARSKTIHLPADLLSCPAWFAADAAARLRAEAQSPR